jgi:hypothetical protein
MGEQDTSWLRHHRFKNFVNMQKNDLPSLYRPYKREKGGLSIAAL